MFRAFLLFCAALPGLAHAGLAHAETVNLPGPGGPCLRLAAAAAPRIKATAYPGAHHGVDAPGETFLEVILPSDRRVTAGGQPAAGEVAQAAVEPFLARHAAGP